MFFSDELTDQEMASSSSSEEEKYDVFLSFRGVDTRENFTSHLYAALCRKKIETYIDYRLERGGEISPALLKAIEVSKLSVIIFSENYANSSWCLDELVHILKCKNSSAQFVVPVFYKIDPSNVRKQTGSFEVAFVEHERRFKDDLNRVKEWREALEEVANLAGWDSMVTRPESKLVDSIVLDILKKLSSISSSDDSKGLVGIDKRVEQVMSLLSIGSQDVRVIGLWGMGGIGKTTLADTIFNRLFYQFDGGCFLTNVREESEKHGLNHLRSKLLSALLEEQEIPSTIVAARTTFGKKRLRKKRVIVVLDDVNDPEQLDTLVGDHEWFSLGSRIIVTSRDEQVLRNATNVQFYEVKELSRDEALQLFHLNAFKNNSAPQDFADMSLTVVDYAKGVPLALKILGSYLHSKSKTEWEKALNKLKMVPNMKLQNVLRISYDGLDPTEKDIFLDIACFFKGEERDLVEKILDGCDLFADVGIPDLIKKSLVTVVKNKVLMHDLIQEMGWEIIRQQSKELGKRSRLWIAEDVHRMLKTNTGSAAIEGIFLDMTKIRDTDLNPTVFAKMYNLRLLKIHNSNKLVKKCKLHFPKGLQSLPDALRYLHWFGYPLKCLPSDFSPENLVVLEMPNSSVERLWDEDQYLDKLRKIDLSYSQHLNHFPDLSLAPNLESLNLEGYRSLLQVPSYFQKFGKLTNLNLSGNSNLKALTAIPQSVQSLSLEDTGIQELPSSIGSLNNLVSLVLRNCKGLKSLSSATQNLQSLDHLNLHGCSSLGDFPDLPLNLTYLNLNGTAIEQVPSEIEGLSSLKILDVGNCKRLKMVPKRIMPLTQDGKDYKPDLEEVSFMNCLELDENARQNVMAYAQRRILRIATASLRPGHGYEESQLFVCCPGNKIPKWFSYQEEGSSINIKLPHRWFGTNFLGFALCVVVEFNDYKDCGSLIFQSESKFKTNLGESYDFDTELFGWHGDEDWNVFCVERCVNSDHIFLWYDYSLNLHFVKGEDLCTTLHNATEASFEFYPVDVFNDPVESCCVKKCGVCLVYAQDSCTVVEDDSREPLVTQTGKSKRPREACEPSGTGIDATAEEEEEPKHKRL